MGNPSAQVTEDQRDAAQLAKSKALDALSQGNAFHSFFSFTSIFQFSDYLFYYLYFNFPGYFDQALDLLTEAILLNPHSAILYATRGTVL